MTEELIPHTVPDKATWPPGPWHDEPDFARFEHLGLPCIVLRSTGSGGWCGYVGVPPGHPWHGKDDSSRDLDVRIHGGITYGNACQGSICHIPKPGESEHAWWLGFDTAHSGDLSPKFIRMNERQGMRMWRDDVYRDLAYITAETKDLATQARRAQGWTTV